MTDVSPQRVPPRRRADWASSRQRILEASSDLFSRNGYRRTSTAELAEAAGVAEATLFRHFPTKAKLFEQAVIAPIRASVTNLAQQRRARPHDVPTEVAAYGFYDAVLRALRKDAGLLIAALAALTFEAETREFTGLNTAFTELLDYIDEVVRVRSVERDFAVEPVIGARMMVAMALGFALGDSMLFTEDNRPSHENLVSEMAKLTSFGLPGKPPNQPPPLCEPVDGA